MREELILENALDEYTELSNLGQGKRGFVTQFVIFEQKIDCMGCDGFNRQVDPDLVCIV